MTVVNVDFTDVESGAGYLPAGTYKARVKSIEIKDGSKAQYLNWCFVSVAPGTEGRVGYLMTSLADNALWKLKGVLEALGAEIPQSKLKLDTDKFIGRVGIIHVVDEPYEGSDGVMRSSFKISDVFPAQGTDEPMPSEPIPAGYDDVDFGSTDDIPF
jgi:hypothetical protein